MPTVKLFELMTLITMIFREEDIPCYPFQTSSYLMSSQGQPHMILSGLGAEIHLPAISNSPLLIG